MPVKILMVCLGNICRSPLAEGILQSKLPTGKFVVDSAGTGGWHAGDCPDHRSVHAAKKRGVDISKQKARQIKKSDFTDFDHIYVMDSSNFTDVTSLAPTPQAKAKVVLMMDEIFPGRKVNVPDPYYGSAKDFDNVFDMLDEVCDIVAAKLIKQHS